MAVNADSGRTRVIPPGPADGDEAITLSLDLSAMPADGATVHDARLQASDVALEPPAGASVRYAILGEAGRGGMATVHVARDLGLMRKVALKQLADGLVNAAPARLRFLREVQITAQLDHPHIVPVYGLEVGARGAPAYSMKLVQGITLADYLRDTRDAYADGGRPDEAHALAARIEHFLKICDAVDYAHGKGVIHRDLKPANVMLGPHREIYVMDWGICRLFGQDDPDPDTGSLVADSTGGNQTEFGSVVGTPRYMSPEQAQGRSEELGPRSDQCALGLMLFELVTLRAPFDGDSALQVLEQAAHGRRAALTHAFEKRAIPAPLRAIIERATRYDPQQRYSGVRALADDLRRFLRGDAVHALPDSLWQRAQRYVGRHRQGVLIGLFALVAGAAMVVALLQWKHEQALIEAQARELAVRDLVDEVARHGDRLQLGLLSLQAEIESLALAATQLLRHGQPSSDATIYWTEDYLSAARRPPDYAARAGFDHPVSLEWAVWGSAPGVERGELLPLAQQLYHLRAYRNELLVLAGARLGGGDYANGVVELRIALQQGLVMRYPGRVVEDERDLRQTPWYRQLTASDGGRWTAPYLDADGDTLLLPLGAALRDPGSGELLGALSIDLALDFIVHNLLRDDNDDDGHRILLLDEEGRILASDEMLRDAAGGEAPALQPFGDAALRESMRDDDVGAIATTAFGRDDVVAFDRIHPLEWILVLVAPAP